MNGLDRGAMTIRDFTQWAGVCRTKTYELIGSGRLRTFKVGARRLIRVTDAQAWLDAAAEGTLEPQLEGLR